MQRPALLLNTTFFLIAAGAGICLAHLPGACQTGPEEAEVAEAALENADGAWLDLNTAGRAELADLPGVGDDVARAVVAARPFRHVDELSRRAGLAQDAIDAILPYVFVRSPAVVLQQRHTLRATRPAGSPGTARGLRVALQTNVAAGNRANLRLVSERDPGEPNRWDHVAGCLEVATPSGSSRIVLGDVRPVTGLGLVWHRRTRTAIRLGGHRTAAPGRFGSATSAEQGALRGVVVAGGIGPVTGWAVAGRAAWDAAEGPTGLVLRESDLHVSETQRQNADRLRERAIGGGVHWAGSEFGLGITAVASRFSGVFDFATLPARGIVNVALDAEAGHGPVRFQAEWAVRTRPAVRHAAAASVEVGIRRIRVEWATRVYVPGYAALRAGPPAAFGRPYDNETGHLAGLVWLPARGWRLEAELDRHRRFRPTATLAVPDRGSRWRLALRRSHAGRRLDLAVAGRRGLRSRSGRIEVQGSRRIRLGGRFAGAPLAPRAWMELARSDAAGASTRGCAAGGQLNAGRWLAVWAATHRAESYDARIYHAEPDVWGGVRLVALSGNGWTAGARVSLSVGPLRLSARYAAQRTEVRRDSWALQVDLLP